MDEKQNGNRDTKLNQVASNPMIRLVLLLAPPDVHDHNRIINDDEIDYALRFIGLLDSSGNRVNRTEEQLCIKQLRLFIRRGELNESRIRQIANYIWSQHPTKPDYAKLISWLNANHPLSVIADTPMKRDSPKSAFIRTQRKKKKKAQRRQRK